MTPAAGPRFRIRLSFADRSERFHCRLAGIEVVSDRQIAELVPFEVQPFEVPRASSRATGAVERTRTDCRPPMVYRGPGWIGGRELDVEARARGTRHELTIGGTTTLTVWRRRGECVVSVKGPDPEGCRFAVLGPGLALALALLGVFSLHASAVVIRGRPLLIVGESGSGKSTAAARAGALAGAERVADDVVPVRVSRNGGAVTALPRFPQLKLSDSQQWRGASELTGCRVVSLRRDVSTGEPRFTELSPRDGLLRLLEGSVASRVFSPQLRAREFDTWGLAAGGDAVLEWLVPEAADRLDEVFASLERVIAMPRPTRAASRS